MGVLEQPRRGRWLVLGLIVVGVAAATFATWFRMTTVRPVGGGARARDIPGEHERIVVEVLNATGTVGLARSATRRLRDAGVDVVYYGSDTAQSLDSTQVLVRRGAAKAGETVREALGTGAVRAAPDATRLVDVSVRLGRDFAPLVRNP